MGSMTLLLILAVIVLFFLVFTLQSRVKAIESRLRQGITATTVPSPSSAPLMQPASTHVTAPTTAASQGTPVSPMAAPTPTPQPTPIPAFDVIAWLKEDWLLKLGALLLLLGFTWLVTLAFSNNWIGPLGRILIGYIAGMGFLAWGWHRSDKAFGQGSVLMVLGSAILMLTSYAAYAIYGFLPPLAALFLMFLGVLVIAIRSVVYQKRSLAITSLALFGVLPLIVNFTQDLPWLFAYLLVVVLGMLWVIAVRKWNILLLLSSILVAFYSLIQSSGLIGFILDYDRPRFGPDLELGLLLIYAITAVFFVAHTTGILRSEPGKDRIHLTVAVINASVLVYWITLAVRPEWRSLMLIAWMLAFTVAAFLLSRMAKRNEPFIVYSFIGIVLLAAATAAQFQGPILTVAYTVEAAVLVFVTYFLRKSIERAEQWSFFLLGPAFLALSSITSPLWRKGIFHEDFLALLVLIIVIGGVMAFLTVLRSEAKQKMSQIGVLWMVVGSLYAFAMLWVVLHAGTPVMETITNVYGRTVTVPKKLLDSEVATMLSLFVYTLVGLITYIMGRTQQRKTLSIYGIIVLLSVVGRLLVVDVWEMDLVGRIVTFLLIGGLLVTAALIGRKKKTTTLEVA